MKINFLALLKFIFIFSLIWTSCSKPPSFEELPPEAMYLNLRGLYEKEKYLAASDGFNYFTLNYSGHALVDSAQSFIGYSHYYMKEYLIAVDAFEGLFKRFPNSPLVPESMYMVGKCYWELSPKYSLDQEFTHSAVDALQSFIDYFPDHRDMTLEAQDLIGKCREKLAHKHYANGLIYLKMKHYRSASIYFQGVLDQYYDTRWAADATYQLAMSLSGEDKTSESREVLSGFIQKYSDHHWIEKAKSELANSKDGENQK